MYQAQGTTWQLLSQMFRALNYSGHRKGPGGGSGRGRGSRTLWAMELEAESQNAGSGESKVYRSI